MMKEPDDGSQEFAITAAHSQSGRVFPPFIVRAKDEAAARKMCQRNYLVLQSVERYAEKDGNEKPKCFPYGPPISDKDFERDYGNRPPDRPTEPKTSYVLAVAGWVLCGPAGSLLGWLIGMFFDEPEKRVD